MNFIRTWSSYSAWQDRFQTKKRDDDGDVDVVDEMFDKMRLVESDWQEDEAWMEKEVEIEWGRGLLLARRRRSSLNQLSLPHTIGRSGTIYARRHSQASVPRCASEFYLQTSCSRCLFHHRRSVLTKYD